MMIPLTYLLAVISQRAADAIDRAADDDNPDQFATAQSCVPLINKFKIVCEDIEFMDMGDNEKAFQMNPDDVEKICELHEKLNDTGLTPELVDDTINASNMILNAIKNTSYLRLL